MAICIIPQDQVYNSTNYVDTLDEQFALSAESLEEDLNYLRSIIKDLHGGATFYQIGQTISDVAGDISGHILETAEGVHGSTVDATADRLVHRDVDGTAKVSSPATSADDTTIATTEWVKDRNIDDLNNVAVSGLVSGEILQYDGNNWVNVSGFTGSSNGNLIGQKIFTVDRKLIDNTLYIEPSNFAQPTLSITFPFGGLNESSTFIVPTGKVWVFDVEVSRNNSGYDLVGDYWTTDYIVPDINNVYVFARRSDNNTQNVYEHSRFYEGLYQNLYLEFPNYYEYSAKDIYLNHTFKISLYEYDETEFVSVTSTPVITSVSGSPSIQNYGDAARLYMFAAASGAFTIQGVFSETIADIIIVGGGGGGGGEKTDTSDKGGGGGAGMVHYLRNVRMPAGDYTVTVGAGGIKSLQTTSTGSFGGSGNPSTISLTNPTSSGNTSFPVPYAEGGMGGADGGTESDIYDFSGAFPGGNFGSAGGSGEGVGSGHIVGPSQGAWRSSAPSDAANVYAAAGGGACGNGGYHWTNTISSSEEEFGGAGVTIYALGNGTDFGISAPIPYNIANGGSTDALLPAGWPSAPYGPGTNINFGAGGDGGINDGEDGQQGTVVIIFKSKEIGL